MRLEKRPSKLKLGKRSRHKEELELMLMEALDRGACATKTTAMFDALRLGFMDTVFRVWPESCVFSN